MTILTRQERERLVLDLYNQGRTYREISKEVRISPRDIGVILNKAVEEKTKGEEGIKQQGNNGAEKNQNQEQQQQQQFNREKDDAKAKYILELDDRKDSSDDKKSSSDKNKDDKKTYKNIKIIECRNFNINAYEVEDLKSIATLLNKPTTFENDDYANGNQQEKSHNEKNSREVKEYGINSNTKVIFICNNENHDLRPVNSGNNLTPQPLPNHGIILPTHSQNSNNNGEDKPAATTTISYAQYKKSISKD